MRCAMRGIAASAPRATQTGKTAPRASALLPSPTHPTAPQAVREVRPSAEALEPDEQYTMFYPSELELSETTLKILVGAHHGLISGAMQTPVDGSYLADAVVLLRYCELDGDMRQAVSVVKKRGGAHERCAWAPAGDLMPQCWTSACPRWTDAISPGA
jgi:hypothetical protein